MMTHNRRKALWALMFASALSFDLQAADTRQLIGLSLDQSRELVNSAMQGRNFMVQVDEEGKIKQIIDTGANGSGSDPLAYDNNRASLPQTSPDGSDTSSDVGGIVSSVPMPVTYGGQHAIDFLGTDLPQVAATYGFTADKFKEVLLNDETSKIDENRQLLFVDDAAGQTLEPGKIAANGAVAQGKANAPIANPNPQVPIASAANLANTFKLHSKPGATKTIYLNFVGYTAANTAWSRSTLAAPAYDLTGNPAVFDNTEMNNIISIWNRVAEDYIPFDVDITTEPPSSDALLRTSASDNTYGTHVVITKSSVLQCSCGGVAYVGVVSLVNNTTRQPAWVFQDMLANNEKAIAEAISHEAGHTIGLIHDGQIVNGTTNSYYAGHGSADTGWAPIMGVGYYKNVTQWDHGSYPGASNQQDDIATFLSAGILPRADDVGNLISNASSLNNIGTGTTATVKNYGVIETNTDVDMYSFATTGGAVSLTVKPTVSGPNLDTKLTLYQDNGTVLLTASPETALSASITSSLPAGTYYLAVANSGHASSGSDYGYLTYGSTGQYAVTGSYPTSGSPVTQLPPTAVITASTTSGLAPLPVTFSANNSIGNGNITGYFWTFGDGTTSTVSNVVHTYSTPGSYTASLLVTNEFGLTNTQQVTINVTVPPQLALRAASYSITGRISKSLLTVNLSVVVKDNKGNPVPNAVVTGSWAGALTGAVTGTSNAKGIANLTPVSTKVLKGASATFTLGNISGKGYTYNPTQNVKSVITISW